MPSAKVQPTRPNDFIYDPVFTVSGLKDQIKAEIKAKASTATFQVCPIFDNMFSDLPHHPRQQLVIRRCRLGLKPSGHRISQAAAKDVDVGGSDRHKFFAVPVPRATVEVPMLTIPSTPKPTTPPDTSRIPKKRNFKMQTMYRESSAQTSPWQPDPIVVDGGDPEILKLDFLKWGSGLPAGMHEVRLIQRARMKRAWEEAMPVGTTKESLKKRGEVIEAIERDQWAFREAEIQEIQDLRLELLEQMLAELHECNRSRMEKKMKLVCDMKQKEKEEKLAKLRHTTERELRKLKMRHLGIEGKYKKWDIIKEHADHTSELYAPLLRHGVHPKRLHQQFDEHLKEYRAQYMGVEDFSTLPRWLHMMSRVKQCAYRKLPGTRLCPRETKWTTPVLRQLHEELKNLRKATKKKTTLRVRIEKEEPEAETPEIEGSYGDDEEEYQHVLLIQNVLRGRAAQMLIFEGRDRCRELIQELRSTHGLQEAERRKKHAEQVEVKMEQRENQLCHRNSALLEEALKRLSGSLVGSLLDFLNKELRRLLDERRAHAMCLLAERERYNREAAEAGRRQDELQRRLEHDEMFKQIAKVRQDTIELYLQDIITEGMEFANEEEASEYCAKLADRIERQTEESKDTLISALNQEELVADLVHNFLMPEIEKEIIRNAIAIKQRKYLKAAHDVIYDQVEDLPRPEPPPPRAELRILRQAARPKSSRRKVSSIVEPVISVSEREDDDSDIIGPPIIGVDPYDAEIQYLLARKDELAGDTTSMQYSVMCDLDDKMDLLSFTSVLKRVGSDSTYVPQNVQDTKVKDALMQDNKAIAHESVETQLDVSTLGPDIPSILPELPSTATGDKSASTEDSYQLDIPLDDSSDMMKKIV